MDIAGNESADKAAKESLKEQSIPNTWISTSYIRRQIRIDTKNQWISLYKNSKPVKYYRAFDRLPGDHRLEWLKGVDRLIFSTIQQMTLGHGYFRSYTGMIKKTTRNCHKCHVIETPKHLLLKCQNHIQERKSIKNKTMAILLITKKGLESAIQYLRDTRVATRKWILGQLDTPEEDAGGWGDLKRN